MGDAPIIFTTVMTIWLKVSTKWASINLLKPIDEDEQKESYSILKIKKKAKGSISNFSRGLLHLLKDQKRGLKSMYLVLTEIDWFH